MSRWTIRQVSTHTKQQSRQSLILRKNRLIAQNSRCLHPPPAAPITADTPKVDTELPCPPPDAIPLGAKNKSQTAVIIGYKVVDGKCEPQLKPLAVSEVIGNYLPAGPVVATTASIAVVATSAAVIAKPLGDVLLKAIKPIVKKTIKKIKEKLGKKTKVESVFDRQKFQRSLRK